MGRVLGFAMLAGVGHSLRGRGKSEEVSADACGEVWNNEACQGQFGSNECYTCGERITYLMRIGYSETDAKQKVANEFLGACGKCSLVPYNIETSGYSMVWNDEFDGEGSPDSAIWNFVNEGSGFGNNELQFYTPRLENSWVSDGSLKIRAKRENYEHRQYTSAKLKSKQSWLYGKLTVRAKMTTGRGTWAAIWSMPRYSSYGNWPRSGEIDVMEHVGYNTGKVHGTIHTLAYHHSIGTQIGGSVSADVTQYHDYTVEWRPDVILFACDNHVYQFFKRESTGGSDTWPFNQEFYLILNLAVGGDWGGQQGIDEEAFQGEGQILEIEYARVEQRESDIRCSEAWNNQACQAHVGWNECYTCGERITYLKKIGYSEIDARQKVTNEFPSECGKCSPRL